MSEKKTIEESNTNAETSLEMTLRLQGGTKEDETMTSVRSGEDRQVLRKHSEISEIGDVQLGDDTEHIKREINNASRRSEEKMESSLQKIQTNTMDRMEKVMRSRMKRYYVQLSGMNTTTEKMKEDSEYKYNRMDEKSSLWKKTFSFSGALLRIGLSLFACLHELNPFQTE